ncbi:MAG: hypothetical protein LBH90_07400 [Tannerella sp.]|nr:hypothetical protein [Tannerella sp.]
MKKEFTRSVSVNKESENMMEKEQSPMGGPYENTLNFVRRFARVYQYEPALDQGLGSYIVN